MIDPPFVEVGESPEDALLAPVGDEEAADDGDVEVGGQTVLQLGVDLRHDARRVQLVLGWSGGRGWRGRGGAAAATGTGGYHSRSARAALCSQVTQARNTRTRAGIHGLGLGDLEK